MDANAEPIPHNPSKPSYHGFIDQFRRERAAWSLAWTCGLAIPIAMALGFAFLPDLEQHAIWSLVLGAVMGIASGAGLWVGLRDPKVQASARQLLIAVVTITMLSCTTQGVARWLIGTSSSLPEVDLAQAAPPTLMSDGRPNLITAADSIPVPPSILNREDPYSASLKKAFAARRKAVRQWRGESRGTQVTAMQMGSIMTILLAQWVMAVVFGIQSVALMQRFGMRLSSEGAEE